MMIELISSMMYSEVDGHRLVGCVCFWGDLFDPFYQIW